jgi:hypothetical protein
MVIQNNAKISVFAFNYPPVLVLKKQANTYFLLFKLQKLNIKIMMVKKKGKIKKKRKKKRRSQNQFLHSIIFLY